MKCREIVMGAGCTLLCLALFCGALAQWLPADQGSSDFVVLKGVANYATSVAVDNSKTGLNVDMGLDNVVAAKPKLYFFALCGYEYWPTQKWDPKRQEYVFDRAGNPVWSGDGYLDLWIVDLLCYGIGRHGSVQVAKRQAVRWDSKAKFAYSGLDTDFSDANWPSDDPWGFVGKGKRVCAGWLGGSQSVGPATWWDDHNGLLQLTYKARKVVDREQGGRTFYEPTAGTIELQGMSQTSFSTTAPKGQPALTLLGIGRVKFTVDRKMTTALDDGGLAELNRQINALLQKGGYPPVANLRW